jgi:tetratricopeptide (TPR) repeat protein
MKATTLHIIFLTVLLCCNGAAFAQDSSKDNEKEKAVAAKACECAARIDGTLQKDKVIAEINSCIRTSKLMADFTAVNKASEEAKEKGDNSKKQYNITYDLGNKAILTLLNSECETVQKLMSASVGDALSKNATAMQLYSEARELTEAKKYEQAISSYKRAVKEDPKFGTAWAYMGLNYRRLEEYNEAIKCYDKALELNPGSEIALQNKAIAYEYLKDYKKASATYEKFVTLHPESPEGYFGAGTALYKCDDYYKGVDYMIKAYLMYKKAESPYIADAEKTLGSFYNDLKAKGKLDIFQQAAKDNNVDLK